MIVVLGTGGTIAGSAPSADDDVGYTAGCIPVATLVQTVPSLDAVAFETEQVAQLDSKDMSFEVWQRLARRVAHHLARDEVSGVVVTHGTDTLEETAFFLQRILAPTKPVVLAAAMRPATSARADGPSNLADAVAVATDPAAQGVLCVLAGTVFGAFDVRKVHTTRLDAFGAGDAGPLGVVQHGRLRQLRPWPHGGVPLGLARIEAPPSQWPRVDVLLSMAGVAPPFVDVTVRGLIVAGTGNGSVHTTLEDTLREAQGRGVRVVRSTRCAFGSVNGPGAFPGSGALTPFQARIELMLELMA